MSAFAPVEDLIAAIGRGELVIVVDDSDRENEGDLIMAAEKVTPEQWIAFYEKSRAQGRPGTGVREPRKK